MVVVMQQSISVAANATNSNVLTGQRYERPPFNALGSLYVNGSALGLTAELNVGGASISEPITVNAANTLPVVPDDRLVEDWKVIRGNLIQLTIVNTTGGALTAFWRVELEG